MLKAFSMTLLGATFVALFTLPAQALEVGPVQVIVQPQVIVAPEPPRRVVVVREPEYRTVVERRVVVVRKHGHRWDRDRYEHGGYYGHDRRDRDRREVIIVRR